MKIFASTSFSSQVNYDTGEVLPEFRDYLERQLSLIEKVTGGGTVWNALRYENYKINDETPGEAFQAAFNEIKQCDLFIAFLSKKISAGVQMEIGMAVTLGKPIILARPDDAKVEYFNNAMIQAELAKEIALPLNENELRKAIEK